MIKKLVFFTVFIFSSFSFAETYIGEGRFYSQKEDSQAFVKQQLLYLAFRDILSKELDKMGLNSKLFWEKYEERFDRSFESIDEELKKKYDLDEFGKGTAKNVVAYKDELREKKLKLKRKFGRIQRAINQFSIENLSRSPKVANARYIKVKGKVNKNKLHEIYLKFTSEDVGRTFKNIFLSLNLNLDGTSWSDLGVESENDFTKVVYAHWKKWFETNTNTFIENIHIADKSKENEIENHLKNLTDDLSEGISLASTLPVVPKVKNDVTNEGESVEVVDEEEEVEDLSELYSEFNRSLWLKLTINVKKQYENEISKQREFEIFGDYILVELDTNSFLTHEDFDKLNKTYSYEDNQKLSSLIASYIYSLPVSSFGALKSKMASIQKSSSKLDINISNATSLYSILKLKEFLADKGIRLSLKPVFKSYDGNEGVLMLNFQGKKENVSSFLFSLNGEDIEPGLQLRVDENSPLSLKLVTTTTQTTTTKKGQL